jgi:lauroyl/myristoyl acyltransferase
VCVRRDDLEAVTGQRLRHREAEAPTATGHQSPPERLRGGSAGGRRLHFRAGGGSDLATRGPRTDTACGESIAERSRSQTGAATALDDGSTILASMFGSGGAVMTAEGNGMMHGVRPRAVSERPRWYWHPHNHAGLYRLAEVLGWLPRVTRLALARRLGQLAPRFLPAERAAVRKTLEVVTGASGSRLEALTVGVFRDFAMCFSDLVSTNRQSAARLVAYVERVSGIEHLQGLSGGIVSVTAHVGNWELAGRLLATRSARRTHVVVAPEEAPELERWVRRDGDGMRFVPRAHPGIGVELLAALRRGEVVALQGDRAIGTRGDVSIPFFGRPAPFPLGPFLLAGAAGVPIVPAFCVLDRGYRYTVRLAPPITVGRGDEEGAARAWVSLLERIVREHPTQWFNFFDVWRPFGEPSPSTAGGNAAPESP